MKTTSIYSTEKKSFIFAADSEQRGLNATLKAIYTTKGQPEANNTLKADSLAWDVFKTASNYVDYLKANLPLVFNANGALCSVKVVEDTTENRDIYAGYQMEECKVNDLLCIRVWLPKVKYTCSEVYNLAKKASKGLKSAEKAAEKAAKAAANEEKKAARTAAKIAKLQKQLAELQK
jgi:hypothetical protein